MCSVAFRPNFTRSLLLDTEPYFGNAADGMFSLIYKQVARALSLKLAVIFRHLVKGG